MFSYFLISHYWSPSVFVYKFSRAKRICKERNFTIKCWSTEQNSIRPCRLSSHSWNLSVCSRYPRNFNGSWETVIDHQRRLRPHEGQMDPKTLEAHIDIKFNCKKSCSELFRKPWKPTKSFWLRYRAERSTREYWLFSTLNSRFICFPYS